MALQQKRQNYARASSTTNGHMHSQYNSSHIQQQMNFPEQFDVHHNYVGISKLDYK